MQIPAALAMTRVKLDVSGHADRIFKRFLGECVSWRGRLRRKCNTRLFKRPFLRQDCLSQQHKEETQLFHRSLAKTRARTQPNDRGHCFGGGNTRGSAKVKLRADSAGISIC